MKDKNIKLGRSLGNCCPWISQAMDYPCSSLQGLCGFQDGCGNIESNPLRSICGNILAKACCPWLLLGLPGLPAHSCLKVTGGISKVLLFFGLSPRAVGLSRSHLGSSEPGVLGPGDGRGEAGQEVQTPRRAWFSSPGHERRRGHSRAPAPHLLLRLRGPRGTMARRPQASCPDVDGRCP